jgi:hypothetical protein
VYRRNEEESSLCGESREWAESAAEAANGNPKRTIVAKWHRYWTAAGSATRRCPLDSDSAQSVGKLATRDRLHDHRGDLEDICSSSQRDRVPSRLPV